jgi:hypothetical protein
VRATEDGAPIIDAHVALRGARKVTAMYDARTDRDGNAVINVTESDDYEVTVSHSGFISVETTLTINLSDDDQKAYNLNIAMRRPGERQSSPTPTPESPSPSPTPTPAPSPSPSPSADDEVTVPDLSVFQSITEMKAVLAHAELKAQMIAAKENPPSKEKEFKVAGQSPAPNTKVKKGSTVTVSIYQKFESTETASTAADDFVGLWGGTVLGEKTTIEIRKEGNGYVLMTENTMTHSGVKKSKPQAAFVKDGKLVSTGDVMVEASDAKGWTSAGRGPKKEFTQHIDAMKLGTTTTTLERKGELLVGTMIIRPIEGKPIEAPLSLTRK